MAKGGGHPSKTKACGLSLLVSTVHRSYDGNSDLGRAGMRCCDMIGWMVYDEGYAYYQHSCGCDWAMG